MKIRINIIKYLANLKFAIVLLILIASLSILGTVIEQDQTVEFYKINYQQTIYSIRVWQIIIQFGLNHIFKTSWFIGLLIIFGSSLMCCTFIQQLPILKNAKKIFFYRKSNQFYKLPLNSKIQNISTGNLLNKLIIKNYLIYQQKNIFYAYKGLSGRIAPIIVHLSLLLILLGAVIGSLMGFKSQELIPKTENFQIQKLISTNIFTYLPTISTRVNDFWITYKQNNIIDQFYTDLSILDSSGNELKRKTISVNKPLQYKNISYYQTDWDIMGTRIRLDNLQIYQIPTLTPEKMNKTIWLTWLPKSKGINIIFDNSRGVNAIYNNFGKFLTYIDTGESYRTSLYNFQIIDLIYITGLQIKVDPGIPLIYTGFGILMISILISYISFSQIWILRQHNTIFIGGRTNRAQINFEIEILNIILELK